MRHIVRHHLFIALFFIASGTLVAQSWNGLTPLKSTKADVRNALGPAIVQSDNTSTFKLAEEKVIVAFSSGKCGETSDASWDVSSDRVVSISVYPLSQLLLEDLKYDLSLFDRTSGSKDLPGTFNYINRKDGIGIVVDEHASYGRPSVISVSYFPGDDQQSLKCKINNGKTK
jgi:hypothetical protein